MSTSPLRIAFAGTPDFAAASLQALIDGPHDIAAVLTQPDRGAGRGKKVVQSPVKKLALAHDLPVLQPESLKDDEIQRRIADLNLDALIVVAYGLIIPRAVLALPRLACVNVHGSLLPRWRGAAPIHRAVMAGDPVTGVTIMQMEAGLDTGPMLTMARTPIEDKTTGELTEELAEIGAQLMVGTLIDVEMLHPLEQDDGEATYAAKIDKAEARIDWDRPAEEVVRHIHGLSPFPGAWFELDGVRVKVLRAEVADGSGKPGEVLDDRLAVACKEGAIRPLKLQRAGKPKMDLDTFLRGNAVAKGTTLA